MDGQTTFMILFGMILVGYAVLYVGGRHYLKEYFQSGSGAGSSRPAVGDLYPTPPPTLPSKEEKDKGKVLMEYVTMDPVAKGQIFGLDDYEYNYVYQNENDREISQELRNKLMSQRPMDWAGLPPSAGQFQAGLKESFQGAAAAVPDAAKPYGQGKAIDPYENINGENMVPPDTLSVEMEERKILQTYQAPTAKDLISYDPDEAAKDPEGLIRKLYDQKGLVPTVAHQEGTNVWEITGVRRKDEKIVYEDEEAPASVRPVEGAGEARISVPAAAADVSAAHDPFYEPGQSGASRAGRWDYQSFTPGLERMFAPTNPTQDWY